MALFKTIDEIKRYVEITGSMQLADLLPSLNLAELKLKRELLGDGQYNAIKTTFEAASSETALVANDKNLLDALRWPLANYMMAFAVPRLQLIVSGSGVHILSDEKKKTAFAWQIKQSVDQYLSSGDLAADQLLDFLETNKATYALWAASTHYTEFKECYINTTAIFESIRRINSSRRVFLALKPTMKYVQDNHIVNVLGSGYAAELLNEVITGTFTAPNATPLAMVRKAVAYLSSSIALAEMSVSVDGDGVLIRTSSNAEEPSVKNPLPEQRMAKLIDQWRDQGNVYLKNLRDFMNANASASQYITYYNSDRYVDPATSDGRFTNDESAGVGIF